MRVLLIFTLFIVGAFAWSAPNEWQQFKNLNKKIYKGFAEELLRLKIYLKNKLLVAGHNLKYATGQETFEVRLNQYADLLQNEIFPVFKGYKKTARRTRSNDVHVISNKPLPENVDWREKGIVTKPKNQGNCGSCWTFAATGALEGQLALKTGKLVSLSEQNLVDCSRFSYGCNGGDQAMAMIHVQQNGGIQTEADYPYTGKNGQCHFDRSKAVAAVADVVTVAPRDEAALKDAIATVGPVAVSIDARNPLLLFYFRGIYASWFCNPDKLDHAVLAVGYGKERGKEYWLIKNSWGAWWGHGGYIKILKNGQNKCGVASEGSYPRLA